MPIGQGAPGASASSSAPKQNSQIRCICGINHDRGTMIQCEVGLTPHPAVFPLFIQQPVHGRYTINKGRLTVKYTL